MTMRKLYLRNRRTGKRYAVLGIDTASGMMTLKGEFAKFTEVYNVPRLKELGYVLEMIEEDQDAVE